MSFAESHPATNEELLWQVAFACAERKDQLAAQVEDQYEQLSAVDIRQLGLYARELHAAKEQTYWQAQAEVRELTEFEAGLLSVIEKIEVGEADEAEIAAFIPTESPTEDSLSKRKLALQAERERVGIDPRDSFYGLLSWDLLYGADPGRLTTGRNRTRITTDGQVGSIAAQSLFFDQTADTHGGKSRRAGKAGNRYTSSSGKRVRKY